MEAAMKRRILLLSVLCAGVFAANSALAQSTYPTKPVRVLVAFGAGGTTDAYARVMASELQHELGQPFVIENVTGGAGLVAATRVAKAPPDGYLLLFTTNVHVIGPALRRKMPFDPDRDFTPLSMVAYSPNMLIVRGDSPFRSLDDFVAAAKTKQGGLSYGSAGFGTSTHLVAEQFAQLIGIRYVHVPYNATSAMTQALLAGDVDSVWISGQATSAFLDSGQLRVIAVADDRRSRFAPNAPTFDELGLKDLASIGTWSAFFGPANMPADVESRLSNALKNILARADVVEKLLRVGADRVRPMEGREMRTLIPKEIALYRDLVKSAKIDPIE
jgi:tripartite-type tricarboxylate transporter receptor subunit TctC